MTAKAHSLVGDVVIAGANVQQAERLPGRATGRHDKVGDADG